MSTHPSTEYLIARGLKETVPKALNEALRIVLQSMEPMAYGAARTGLTAAEQAVLVKGGLHLERRDGPDPLADTVVKYAAIVKRSLSTNDVSDRLGIKTSRVRQLIASKSLYSFLIDGTRYIPDFQFGAEGLVPNITAVNKIINQRKHPVAIYNWYHLANPDLFLDDDIDATVAPLDWLKGGHDLDKLLLVASFL